MRKRINQIAVIALLVVLVAGIVFLIFKLDPEIRPGWLGNQMAHCPNCSSFLRIAMESYAGDHDGWFPKGGKNPLDSLVQLLKYENLVHVYTCHALAQQLRDNYKKTGTFSEEDCCYRYNEGLRAEDPDDLIVLYYFKPTRWTSHSSKGSILGRQVLSPSGQVWSCIPEAEFQERQKKTLEFLLERKRRSNDTGVATANLILSVECTTLAPNSYRFTAKLDNRSDSASTVRLLEPAHLVHRQGQNCDSYFLDKEGTEIHLMPQETYSFPGWLELTVEDQFRDGKLESRTTCKRDFTGSNASDGTPLVNTEKERSGSSPGVDVSIVNAGCYVKAYFRANVTLGAVQDLDVVIKSQECKYMISDNKTTGDK